MYKSFKQMELEYCSWSGYDYNIMVFVFATKPKQLGLSCMICFKSVKGKKYTLGSSYKESTFNTRKILLLFFSQQPEQ